MMFIVRTPCSSVGARFEIQDITDVTFVCERCIHDSRTTAEMRSPRPSRLNSARSFGRYAAVRSVASFCGATARARGGVAGAKNSVVRDERGGDVRPHGGWSIHSSAMRWFASRPRCSCSFSWNASHSETLAPRNASNSLRKARNCSMRRPCSARRYVNCSMRVKRCERASAT